MWKWIGIVALVLVALVGTCTYMGYRKISSIASSDSTSTVVIGATPDRVFASLATGDSTTTWMTGGTIRPSRAGTLKAGDTLFVSQRDSSGTTASAWVVTEIDAPRTVAFEMNLSGAGGEAPMRLSVRRRFVLEARGDSTALMTTVVAPGADSVAQQMGAGGAAGGMIGFGTKVMLGAMRMQSQLEVGGLKSRIEGTAAAARP